MAASAGSQHRCVFVGNIPYDATEEQLIQICEEVGPVVSFRLVLDRETGKPKGYGFCEYKDEETALSARRNLQGYDINGRQLRVDFAENDKGADRNREQGRGGPGMNSDANKAFPGASSISGDSSLHQPLGHQLAASAASSMARVLGGAQSSSLPLFQNGVQNLSGPGNDPLTQYLAKMSRQQLTEIISEMRALVAQNKLLAQQLLQGIPQLPKALFQAEIMLGMVTPQIMQMANTRQPSSSVPQPALQNNTYNQNQLLSSQLAQTPSQALSALVKPAILQHSVPPLQHVSVQPSYHPPLQPQPQLLSQGTIPISSGGSIHPQPFGGQPQFPPLPNSKGLISQVQPSLLPQSRLGGATNNVQHPQPPLPESLQQSYLPHPPTSQSGLPNYSVLPNGRDSFQKEGLTAAASHDLTWGSMVGRVSTSGAGSAEQTGAAGDTLEAINHQPKRPRLDDGGGARLGVTERTSTGGSLPPQSISAGSLLGSQTANADAGKQTPQLPPDVESALLQQVMNLTPEQISALPLEQQQQVLLLQQHLMKQNL